MALFAANSIFKEHQIRECSIPAGLYSELEKDVIKHFYTVRQFLNDMHLTLNAIPDHNQQMI